MVDTTIRIGLDIDGSQAIKEFENITSASKGVIENIKQIRSEASDMTPGTDEFFYEGEKSVINSFNRINEINKQIDDTPVFSEHQLENLYAEREMLRRGIETTISEMRQFARASVGFVQSFNSKKGGTTALRSVTDMMPSLMNIVRQVSDFQRESDTLMDAAAFKAGIKNKIAEAGLTTSLGFSKDSKSMDYLAEYLMFKGTDQTQRKGFMSKISAGYEKKQHIYDSFTDMLPENFRSFHASKGTLTAGYDATPLTAKERRAIGEMLKNNLYFMQAAEASGVGIRQNGILGIRSGLTRGMINQLAGNLYNTIIQSAKGMPMYGIDDVDKKEYWERIARKSNKPFIGSMNSARILSDNFDWLRPVAGGTYKDDKTATFTPLRDDKGRPVPVSFSPDIKRYEVANYTLEDLKKNIDLNKNRAEVYEQKTGRDNRYIPIDHSARLENIFRHRSNGIMPKHNEAVDDLFYVELDERLSDPRLEENVREQLMKEYASYIDNGITKIVNGKKTHFSFTRAHKGLGLEFVEDSIFNAMAPIDPKTDQRDLSAFWGGVKIPKISIHDKHLDKKTGKMVNYTPEEVFNLASKMTEYASKDATSGESIESLYGTILPENLKIGIFDLEDAAKKSTPNQSIEGPGMNGTSYISKRLVPGGFQARLPGIKTALNSIDFGGFLSHFGGAIKTIGPEGRIEEITPDLDLLLSMSDIKNAGIRYQDDQGKLLPTAQIIENIRQEIKNNGGKIFANKTMNDAQGGIHWMSRQFSQILGDDPEFVRMTTQAFLDEYERVGTLEGALNTVFSDDSEMRNLILSTHGAIMSDRKVQDRIQDFRLGMLSRISNGDTILPRELETSRGMAQPWLFNAVKLGMQKINSQGTGLAKDGEKNYYDQLLESLTDEQRETLGLITIDDNEVAFRKIMAEVLGIGRYPATSHSARKAKNVLAGSSKKAKAIKDALEKSGFDPTAMYISPSSPIMQLLQDADFDGDVLDLIGLAYSGKDKNGKKLRAAEIFSRVYEKGMAKIDNKGLSQEETEARKKQFTNSVFQMDSFDATKGMDVMRIITPAKQGGYFMGTPDAVVRNAMQIPWTTAVVKALSDSESQYSVNSVRHKQGTEMDTTPEQMELLTKYRAFTEFFHAVNKNRDDYGNVDIPKLAQAMASDDGISGAKFWATNLPFHTMSPNVRTMMLSRYFAKQRGIDINEGYDWNYIFDSILGPKNTETALGRMQAGLRDAWMGYLNADYLALDEESIAKLGELRAEAIKEEAAHIKEERDKVGSSAYGKKGTNRSIAERMVDRLGGRVIKNAIAGMAMSESHLSEGESNIKMFETLQALRMPNIVGGINLDELINTKTTPKAFSEMSEASKSTQLSRILSSFNLLTTREKQNRIDNMPRLSFSSLAKMAYHPEEFMRDILLGRENNASLAATEIGQAAHTAIEHFMQARKEGNLDENGLKQAQQEAVKVFDQYLGLEKAPAGFKRAGRGLTSDERMDLRKVGSNLNERYNTLRSFLSGNGLLSIFPEKEWEVIGIESSNVGNGEKTSAGNMKIPGKGKKILTPSEDVEMTGSYDLMFRNKKDGRIVMADMKNYWDPNAEDWEKWRVQQAIYASQLKKNGIANPDGSIIGTTIIEPYQNRQRNMEFTEYDLMQSDENVAKAIQAIQGLAKNRDTTVKDVYDAARFIRQTMFADVKESVGDQIAERYNRYSKGSKKNGGYNIRPGIITDALWMHDRYNEAVEADEDIHKFINKETRNKDSVFTNDMAWSSKYRQAETIHDAAVQQEKAGQKAEAQDLDARYEAAIRDLDNSLGTALINHVEEFTEKTRTAIDGQSGTKEIQDTVKAYKNTLNEQGSLERSLELFKGRIDETKKREETISSEINQLVESDKNIGDDEKVYDQLIQYTKEALGQTEDSKGISSRSAAGKRAARTKLLNKNAHIKDSGVFAPILQALEEGDEEAALSAMEKRRNEIRAMRQDTQERITEKEKEKNIETIQATTMGMQLSSAQEKYNKSKPITNAFLNQLTESAKNELENNFIALSSKTNKNVITPFNSAKIRTDYINAVSNSMQDVSSLRELGIISQEDFARYQMQASTLLSSENLARVEQSALNEMKLKLGITHESTEEKDRKWLQERQKVLEAQRDFSKREAKKDLTSQFWQKYKTDKATNPYAKVIDYKNMRDEALTEAENQADREYESEMERLRNERTIKNELKDFEQNQKIKMLRHQTEMAHEQRQHAFNRQYKNMISPTRSRLIQAYRSQQEQKYAYQQQEKDAIAYRDQAKELLEKQQEAFEKKYEVTYDRYSQMSKEEQKQYEEKGDVKSDAQAIAATEQSMHKYASAAQDAADASQRLSGPLPVLATGFNSLQTAVSRLVARFGRQIFYSAINEAKRFVKEFNAAMTSIQMITLKTDEEMSNIGDGLIAKAKELKISISEISQIATTLYRQGLSTEEVDERLDVISKFSKVSGTKAGDATKLVTVALNTGLVSSAQEASDIVTALGDNAATNAQQIEKGIEKAGAAAAADGTTFGQLAAMLTAITSTTQIGGNVAGRTLNTIFGRMNKIGTNELMYDENGHAISGSSVSQLLSAQGVRTYDKEGNKRSSFDVLYDLSQKWEGMSDAEQQQIATAIAGTRQYSNFAAIMQGMQEGDIDQYMELIGESTGITDKKYDVYLKSLQATIDDLKNTFNDLVATLVDEGVLNDVAELFKTIINSIKVMSQSGLGLASLIPIMVTLAGLNMAMHANSWAGAGVGLAIAAAGGIVTAIAGTQDSRTEEEKTAEKAKQEQNLINKEASQLNKTERAKELFYKGQNRTDSEEDEYKLLLNLFAENNSIDIDFSTISDSANEASENVDTLAESAGKLGNNAKQASIDIAEYLIQQEEKRIKENTLKRQYAALNGNTGKEAAKEFKDNISQIEDKTISSIKEADKELVGYLFTSSTMENGKSRIEGANYNNFPVNKGILDQMSDWVSDKIGNPFPESAYFGDLIKNRGNAFITSFTGNYDTMTLSPKGQALKNLVEAALAEGVFDDIPFERLYNDRKSTFAGGALAYKTSETLAEYMNHSMEGIFDAYAINAYMPHLIEWYNKKQTSMPSEVEITSERKEAVSKEFSKYLTEKNIVSSTDERLPYIVKRFTELYGQKKSDYRADENLFLEILQQALGGEENEAEPSLAIQEEKLQQLAIEGEYDKAKLEREAKLKALGVRNGEVGDYYYEPETGKYYSYEELQNYVNHRAKVYNVQNEKKETIKTIPWSSFETTEEAKSYVPSGWYVEMPYRKIYTNKNGELLSKEEAENMAANPVIEEPYIRVNLQNGELIEYFDEDEYKDVRDEVNDYNSLQYERFYDEIRQRVLNRYPDISSDIEGALISAITGYAPKTAVAALDKNGRYAGWYYNEKEAQGFLDENEENSIVSLIDYLNSIGIDISSISIDDLDLTDLQGVFDSSSEEAKKYIRNLTKIGEASLEATETANDNLPDIKAIKDYFTNGVAYAYEAGWKADNEYALRADNMLRMINEKSEITDLQSLLTYVNTNKIESWKLLNTNKEFARIMSAVQHNNGIIQNPQEQQAEIYDQIVRFLYSNGRDYGAINLTTAQKTKYAQSAYDKIFAAEIWAQQQTAAWEKEIKEQNNGVMPKMSDAEAALSLIAYNNGKLAPNYYSSEEAAESVAREKVAKDIEAWNKAYETERERTLVKSNKVFTEKELADFDKMFSETYIKANPKIDEEAKLQEYMLDMQWITDDEKKYLEEIVGTDLYDRLMGKNGTATKEEKEYASLLLRNNAVGLTSITANQQLTGLRDFRKQLSEGKTIGTEEGQYSANIASKWLAGWENASLYLALLQADKDTFDLLGGQEKLDELEQQLDNFEKTTQIKIEVEGIKSLEEAGILLDGTANKIEKLKKGGRFTIEATVELQTQAFKDQQLWNAIKNGTETEKREAILQATGATIEQYNAAPEIVTQLAYDKEGSRIRAQQKAYEIARSDIQNKENFDAQMAVLGWTWVEGKGYTAPEGYKIENGAVYDANGTLNEEETTKYKNNGGYYQLTFGKTEHVNPIKYEEEKVSNLEAAEMRQKIALGQITQADYDTMSENQRKIYDEAVRQMTTEEYNYAKGNEKYKEAAIRNAQNNYTKTQIEYSVDGVAELEEAGKVLEGTKKLLEAIQQDGTVKIKAEIDFISGIKSTQQQKALIENGTFAERVSTLATINNMSPAEVIADMAGATAKATNYFNEKENETIGTFEQGLKVNPFETASLAMQSGYQLTLKRDKSGKIIPTFKKVGTTSINREDAYLNVKPKYNSAKTAASQREILNGTLTAATPGRYEEYETVSSTAGAWTTEYRRMKLQNDIANALRIANPYTEEQLTEVYNKALAEISATEYENKRKEEKEQLYNESVTSAGKSIEYGQYVYNENNRTKLAAQRLYESLGSGTSLNEAKRLLNVTSSARQLEDLQELYRSAEYADFERRYIENGQIRTGYEEEARIALANLTRDYAGAGYITKSNKLARANEALKIESITERAASEYGNYIKEIYGDEVYSKWLSGETIDASSASMKLAGSKYVSGYGLTGKQRLARISEISSLEGTALTDYLADSNNKAYAEEVMSGFSGWQELAQLKEAKGVDYDQFIELGGQKRLNVLNEQLEAYKKNAQIDYEVEGLSSLEEAGELLSGTVDYIKQLKKDGRIEIEAIVKLTTEAHTQGQLEARLNSSNLATRAAAVMEVTGATQEEYYNNQEYWDSRAQTVRAEERASYAETLAKERATQDTAEELAYFDEHIAQNAGYKWIEGVPEGYKVGEDGNLYDEKTNKKANEIVQARYKSGAYEGHYKYTGNTREERTGYNFEKQYTNSELSRFGNRLLNVGYTWNEAVNQKDRDGNYYFETEKLEALKNYSPDLYKYMTMTEEQQQSIEGQNLYRKIQLQFSVEGIQQLEEAGDILSGTADLIERIQKGGLIKIEAELEWRQRIQNAQQERGLILSGTIAEQVQQIAATNKVDEATVWADFENQRQEALAYYELKEEKELNSINELAKKDSASAAKRAAELGALKSEDVYPEGVPAGTGAYVLTTPEYTMVSMLSFNDDGSLKRDENDEEILETAYMDKAGNILTEKPERTYPDAVRKNYFAGLEKNYTAEQLAQFQNEILGGTLTAETIENGISRYDEYLAGAKSIGQYGQTYLSMLEDNKVAGKGNEIWDTETLLQMGNLAYREAQEYAKNAKEETEIKESKLLADNVGDVFAYTQRQKQINNKAGFAANTIYQELTSGKIENVADLADVVNKSDVQNWKDLLESSEEVRKAFDNMGVSIKEDGTLDFSGIENAGYDAATALDVLKQAVLGASEAYSKRKDVLSTEETLARAQNYLNGTGDEEQGFEALSEVTGNSKFAQFIRNQWVDWQAQEDAAAAYDDWKNQYDELVTAKRKSLHKVKDAKSGEYINTYGIKETRALNNFIVENPEPIKVEHPGKREISLDDLNDFESTYATTRMNNLNIGLNDLTDLQQFAGLQDILQLISSGKLANAYQSDRIGAFSAYTSGMTGANKYLAASMALEKQELTMADLSGLKEETPEYEKAWAAIKGIYGSMEDAIHAQTQWDAELQSKSISLTNKYGDATGNVVDYVNKLSKGAKSAVPAIGSMISTMNKLGYQNKQLQGMTGKAGSQLSSEQLDVVSEIRGIPKEVLKTYGADMMSSIVDGAKSAIDQQWADEIAAPIVEQLNQAFLTADSDKQIEIGKAIRANVNLDTGAVDVAGLANALKDIDSQLYEVLMGYAETGATLMAEISEDGTSAGYIWKLLSAGAGTTGKKTGGGGGGKSAVDKLLEAQKRKVTAAEHDIKMLETEEKQYDYLNDYTGWAKNIDDQIAAQLNLKKVYTDNIAEMEEQLKKVKEGSDDWYKLKEAIYSAQEAYEGITNTINELNTKKDITLFEQQIQERDKPETQSRTMLQKLAARAMSENRFADYLALSQQDIAELNKQREKNNEELYGYTDENGNEVQGWLARLENEIEGSDAWIAIRDKIWAIEAENAELENESIQKTLELNEQRLSQIAKVLEYDTGADTHNKNIASTYSNYYQTAGHRSVYEDMIKVQLASNENILEETRKAEEAAREQMATLEEGSAAWYAARAAVYQYQEAIAQTNVTQLELNRSLAESNLASVSEKFTDATREVAHVNEMLSARAQEYLTTNDYKAYEQAMTSYIGNLASELDAQNEALGSLKRQYYVGMAMGTLDPEMQRQYLDQINERESAINSLQIEQASKQRELNKTMLDAMFEEQSRGAGNYNHNLQLLQYQASKYQNAKELTNYGKALEQENKLRKDRVTVLREELAQLEEQHKNFQDGSDDEERIVEEIKKHEEAIDSENLQIEKNNELLKQNQQKIREVQKTLEDAVDKEIEAEKKRQREILSANVSMQDTILNLLKKRLQDEWDLKKKDIEKEKESLNAYKKLINDRFNYRKKASQQADKDEELADYRRQLALIEADPSRTKDAKELRRKIEELEKDKAWTIAEGELEDETSRIDENIKTMDDYISYQEEKLNEFLSDANNFAAQLGETLSGSFEESYDKIIAFMEQENEAFTKSLPDAQKQMIQSWEDTWKKAKDILDSNYVQITAILQDKDTYMDYIKSVNQDYRKAREDQNENEMKRLETIYEEYWDNNIAARKNDATFETHEHDLSDVESKIDELKDNVFQVNVVKIVDNAPGAEGFDENGVKFVDKSNGERYTRNDYEGTGKAAEKPEPEETPSETSKSSGKASPKSKVTVYYQTSSGVINSVTADTEKEAYALVPRNALWASTNKDELTKKNGASSAVVADAKVGTKTESITGEISETKKKINEIANKAAEGILKDAIANLSLGSIATNDNGGLMDYTGLAWVDGSKVRPESFLDSVDTALLREMLDTYSYVRNTPYMSNVDTSQYVNNTSVGDVNITINQAELKSDADIASLAKRVGQAFTKELKINGIGTAGYSFA